MKAKTAILLALLAGIAFALRDLPIRRTLISWWNADPLPTAKNGGYHVDGEEQWLVDETCRDIAEVLLPARDRGRTVKNFDLMAFYLDRQKYNLVVRVNKTTVQHNLNLTNHVWAKENYEPLAKKLIEGWGITYPSRNSPDNDSLLQLLTTPTSAILITESKRISEALIKAPLDAELHEEAALLMGAFAMKEAAGSFSDVRAALCRISAELAVASALRKNEAHGKNGDAATIVLLTLANRGAEALDRLAKTPFGEPKWENALRMRNTGDWRLLQQPSKASFLEQFEYARAAARGRSTLDAGEFVAKHSNSPARPEWSRLITENRFSIQDGHQYVAPGSALELQDLAEDFHSFHGRELSEANVLTALNVPADQHIRISRKDNATGLTVLSWGDFAAFHQRHLCNSILQTAVFLRDELAIPEEAAAFVEVIRGRFSELRMFPLFQVRFAKTKSDYAAAMPPAKLLCESFPEIITADHWEFLRKGGKLGSSTVVNSFCEGVPFGTAFDISARIARIGGSFHGAAMASSLSVGDIEWDAFKAMAPYDYDILKSYSVKKHGAKPSAVDVEDVFQLIKDFNFHAKAAVARAYENDPEKYLAYVRPMSAASPNWYFKLGSYLMRLGRDAEAAVAYQNGVTLAPDRVLFAQESRWLVNYYLDHDREHDALEIATQAGNVGSLTGLETFALFLERTKKLGEAEDVFRAIKERYDDEYLLTGFYGRNPNPKWDAIFRERQDTLFPNGLERVSLESFKEKPADGLIVTSSSYWLDRHGIGTYSVFMSLDGVRVRSREQYTFLRLLSADPHMKLIVWSMGKYREVAVNLPDRQFRCDIATYRNPDPNPR